MIDGAGAVIADAAIHIEQGKIVYAGARNGSPPPPAESSVIDAAELTAMPGLIDGHNGYTGSLDTIPTLQGFLRYGVTTAATFLGNAAGKGSVMPLRKAISAGQLPGCAAILAGFVVNGSSAFQRGETADGPWAVRRAVRKAAEAGADFIKAAATGSFANIAHRTYTREELHALVDEAHSWGVPVAIHAHTQPGLGHVIEAGADILVHGCMIDRDAIDKMAKRGTRYMPTLRVTSKRNLSGFAEASSDKAIMTEAAPIHRAGVKLAIEAGVPILMGGHGPGVKSIWPRSGETSAFELAELVECGLTPHEAIRAATLHAAEAFRLDKRIGSLAPGKQADLLLVRGNPLERIELLQERDAIAVVFRNGRIEHVHDAYKPIIGISHSPE
jgi:imidazolonepropionase-like amidohydrolase